MKNLINVFDGDFFHIVKLWMVNVDQHMKIKKNGKLEVKYVDGHHYLVYPLDCTLEKADEDIQWLHSSAGIAEEDNNIYIIKRLNELLADSLEFGFDSYKRGQT